MSVISQAIRFYVLVVRSSGAIALRVVKCGLHLRRQIIETLARERDGRSGCPAWRWLRSTVRAFQASTWNFWGKWTARSSMAFTRAAVVMVSWTGVCSFIEVPPNRS